MKTLMYALRVTLLLGSALYFFTHVDLTNLVFFQGSHEPREEAPQPQATQPVSRHDAEPQAPQDIPVEPQADTATQAAPSMVSFYYSYTDEQGVVHIVDNLDAVPQRYRQGMKVERSSAPKSDVTPVVIKGNQVLVPVTVSFHGRTIEAQLLLDTGATVTTVSERLASLLGVAASDMRAGKATVADGRSIGSYLFVADSLAVGSRSLPRLQASILPGSGGEGYDGLLGMNFLKNFRYHVDFNRSVIEWGG